ncbi:MAG: DUF6020 family protein [Bifidobacteriaceae bacterium]|jgi:hypothetical protein|nr:DUF6020 family protein [Bifidobacteriaceae bacterium]
MKLARPREEAASGGGRWSRALLGWDQALRGPLTWVLGVVFGAATAVGVAVIRDGSAHWTSPWLYVTIAALAAVFAGAVAAARWLVERPRLRPMAVWRNRPRAFFFDWAVIWLAWTPVWLSGWPGFWCYDAATAHRLASGHALTTAMPPLHTFLATGVEIGVAKLTGHDNYGIAAWIMLQSVAVAAVFAFALRRLRAWRVPRGVRWGALAYFAVFPTIALFSLNWARNTAFSAVVLALAVCTVDALKQPRRWRWWLVAALAVAAIAMRRDAVYGFILFALLAVIVRQPARKALAACFISAAVAGLLLDPLVYKGILHLPAGNAVAAYSVPLQQLARAYNASPSAMTPDQRAVLESYVKPEALAVYRPQLADPVMLGADTARLQMDTKRFVKLWAEVGLAHPGIYADALAANTVQGWLPGAVVDVYSVSGPDALYPATGTSYFCYNTESPGVADPKGPAFVHQAYAAFSSKSKVPFETPILAWLWSPATYLWLTGFAAALAWARGRSGQPTAFLPVGLLLLATCVPVFAGPGMLVRYFLPFFYCAPLVAAFLADPRVFDLRRQAVTDGR